MRMTATVSQPLPRTEAELKQYTELFCVPPPHHLNHSDLWKQVDLHTIGTSPSVTCH